MILAVDPSIASSGAALFSVSGRLVACARITMPTDTEVDPVIRWRRMAEKIRMFTFNGGVPDPIERIVCERPQIYARAKGKTKGDPNGLIHMVGVLGALAMRFPDTPVTSYLPAEWKGQLPVDTLVRRVCARLTPAELELVPMRTVKRVQVCDPDVGHAVGVGLRYLGRLEPARVFPGASPG